MAVNDGWSEHSVSMTEITTEVLQELEEERQAYITLLKLSNRFQAVHSADRDGLSTFSLDPYYSREAI